MIVASVLQSMAVMLFCIQNVTVMVITFFETKIIMPTKYMQFNLITCN